jgi:hypothetical protein
LARFLLLFYRIDRIKRKVAVQSIKRHGAEIRTCVPAVRVI